MKISNVVLREMGQQGHGKGRPFFEEEENSADDLFSDENEATVRRKQMGQQGHGKCR